MSGFFRGPLAELREAFFSERRKVVRKINEDILIYLVDGPSRMAPDAAAASRRTLDTLQSRFGYCEHCAKDAVAGLGSQPLVQRSVVGAAGPTIRATAASAPQGTTAHVPLLPSLVPVPHWLPASAFAFP